jgi:hypothetical protein
MHRFALLLSVVAVLLLGLVAGGIRTRAQDATPDAMTSMMATATHPVVGLWRTTVSNQGEASFSSLTTFHADSTYTEVLPFGLVLSGVWQPTGEQSATVTAYLSYFNDDDRLVNVELRLTVEVDETGNALTEEGTVVELYEDGSVSMAVESPATGTRLEVLPVEPLGTPVFPADPAAAGTPTP